MDAVSDFLNGVKGDLEKVASDESTALKEAGLVTEEGDDEYGAYDAVEKLASFLESETDIVRAKNDGTAPDLDKTAAEKKALEEGEADPTSLEGDDEAGEGAVAQVLEALEEGKDGEGSVASEEDMGDDGSPAAMAEEEYGEEGEPYKMASVENGLLVFGVPIEQLMEKEAFAKGFQSVIQRYKPVLDDVTFSTIQSTQVA